jgi:Tol biopolymer transport system component
LLETHTAPINIGLRWRRLGLVGNFHLPEQRTSIGFSAGGKLERIDLAGGPPVTLADAHVFYGASWSPQGIILFSPGPTSPLLRIPEAGGTATPVTAVDPARKEDSSPRDPWFLPDGRHFLYTVPSITTNDTTTWVGSLDSPETRIVVRANSTAIYASGYLLFLRDHTLMAQPFDAKRLVTRGEAVPVAGQITDDPARTRGFFTVSGTGTLVFQSGVQAGQTLAWLDRTGKRLGTMGEPGQLLDGAFLSPDGKRAAVTVLDSGTGIGNLWIYDLARNLRSRFAFDPTPEKPGVWSPDGAQIVFSCLLKGHFDLYRKLASGAGAEELLYADGLDKFPTSWSPDGKYLMYYSIDAPKTGKTRNALWVLPLEGERKPLPFLKTDSNEENGQFSPDGRWVAYQSNEAGRSEIYLAPFSGSGGKRQVSVSGGQLPRWRADGKEIFYIAPNSRMMAVEVSIKGAEVEVGAVRSLFGPLPASPVYPYDVSADGQRFLAVLPNEQTAPEPLTLAQNWTAGLKK